MTLRFTIHGETISLNEYINAERSNRFMAAKIKREEMERIMLQLPSDKLTGKINITLRAFVKDRRKDPDNIYTYFVKSLLDSMVEKGMIEDDGQKNIGRITLEPVNIGEPRVEVSLSPCAQRSTLSLSAHSDGKEEHMDIQVAWQNLLSAIERGLWGEASEIADDVLEWIAKDGLPPTIIGKPILDRLIAKALAESVAAWDV